MKSVRPILAAADIARMDSALTSRGSRFGLLWRLGIYTGLRVSDLLRLRPKDFKGLRLDVRETKSGKRKLIRFDRKQIAEIRGIAAEHRLHRDDFLFFRSHRCKHKPMSRQWARRVIALTARNLSIDEVGAHSMRKIYACNIFRSTGDLEAVRVALNHSKVETTLIYLRDVLPAGR